MQIIGLHGKARAGKDSIADYLVEQYGFVKFGFADALYKEVANAFGVAPFFLQDADTKDVESELMSLWRCTDEAFKVVALKKLQTDFAISARQYQGQENCWLSPRWVMQTWGTEYRRAQDPNYWVHKAGEFVENFLLSLQMSREEVEEWNNNIKDNWRVQQCGDMTFPPDDLEGLLDPLRANYKAHPGLVNVNVRFENEYVLIKYKLGGEVWHVQRNSFAVFSDGGIIHASEKPLPFRTGDKLFLNYGDADDLRTGVTLMLQGNGIVNTGGGE